MIARQCNIDQTDRINRLILGLMLCLGVILGASRLYFLVFGLVMIIEGIVGWCAIPYFFRKATLKKIE